MPCQQGRQPRTRGAAAGWAHPRPCCGAPDDWRRCLPGVIIRKSRSGDLPAIAQLFYQTVQRVNARDYRTGQIDAWAPRIRPASWWRRRLAGQRVYVAEQDGAIIGFASLARGGYLDCCFVHHRWQHCGVASGLLKAIELQARKQRIVRLSADVSISARAFFAAMGFRTVRLHIKKYRNRSFRQFCMEKRIA